MSIANDSDNLEADVETIVSAAAQENKLAADHIDLDSELYQVHRSAVLPGQILTDAIAKLRFVIGLVGFFYSGLFFLFGILAVGLLAPDLLFMLNHQSPILMITAQLMISLLAFALGLFCIGIILQGRGLTSKLALAEVMIDTLRDQAMIQMQATRYNLEDLTEKLKFPKEDNNHTSPLDYIDLAKRIGPVIGLLMAKERSVVTIAVEGLKLFSAFKKVLKK